MYSEKVKSIEYKPRERTLFYQCVAVCVGSLDNINKTKNYYFKKILNNTRILSLINYESI